MNDRIRELGREATIWCVSQPNQDDFDSMWEEKFAELIVRECVLISRTSSDGFSAGKRMEEHFGVES